MGRGRKDMKNSKIAQKVYGVLAETCEENFQGKTHELWQDYLESNGIGARDYDEAADAAEDLMEMANDGTDHVVCFDPFSDVFDHIGGFQFLMIPKEIAEKIAVFGNLP